MLTAAAPAAANASVRNLMSLFMIVAPFRGYITAASLGCRSRKRGYFVAVQRIWRLEATERCT